MSEEINNRCFDTLIQAASQLVAGSPEDVIRSKTKIFHMNCRNPGGCKGRQVYMFSKDDAGSVNYQCSTCSYRWLVNTGGSFLNG